MICILITENDHECGINTGLNPLCWVLALSPFCQGLKKNIFVKVDKMLVTE